MTRGVYKDDVWVESGYSAAMGSGSKLLIPAIIASFAGVGLDMIGNTLQNAYPNTPHWVWLGLFWLSLLLISGLPFWLFWQVVGPKFPNIYLWWHRKNQSYLSGGDSSLGSAISGMARRSAWGRWYAAQDLALGGIPISEEFLLGTACSVVWQKILDGELEVRGRLPGKLDYEPIPRTHWHSTCLHFIKDPRTLWKLVLIPTGGVEIEPSGIQHARDPAAKERTAVLQAYDNLIVDDRQFEGLFPRFDRIADAERKKFLKQARNRNLDAQEIKRLS